MTQPSVIKTPTGPSRFEPRREPQQARSRERIERILDATAGLLAEAGVDGLSTRLIARRAGVNVATIYQFFPNKYAVITAVFERTADRLIERHAELTNGLDQTLPTSDEHERHMARFAEAVLEIPGFFPLRRAVHALPELAEARAAEERAKQVIGERIIRRLSRLNPGLTAAQREVMAGAIIETTLALLEHSTRVPQAQRSLVLAELRTMMISYLAHYFGPVEALPAPAPATR